MHTCKGTPNNKCKVCQELKAIRKERMEFEDMMKTKIQWDEENVYV